MWNQMFKRDCESCVLKKASIGGVVIGLGAFNAS